MLKRLAFFLLLFALATVHVFGTKCGSGFREVSQKTIGLSSSIFLGKVTSVKYLDGGISLIEFRVKRIWKGPKQEILSVTTGPPGSGGYSFLVDHCYLVFAYFERNELNVSYCSPTKPLAQAHVDMAQLGIPQYFDSGEFCEEKE